MMIGKKIIISSLLCIVCISGLVFINMELVNLFSVDERVQGALQENKITFNPASPSQELKVSSNEALEIAFKYLEGRLTQKAQNTKIEFVSYSDPSAGIENKLVWKVELIGAPVKLEGVQDIKTGKHVDKQSTSKHTLTYVIIDPLSSEVLTMFSSGPMHD